MGQSWAGQAGQGGDLRSQEPNAMLVPWSGHWSKSLPGPSHSLLLRMLCPRPLLKVQKSIRDTLCPTLASTDMHTTKISQSPHSQALITEQGGWGEVGEDTVSTILTILTILTVTVVTINTVAAVISVIITSPVLSLSASSPASPVCCEHKAQCWAQSCRAYPDPEQVS